MNSKSELIKDLKKTMEFYRELGFKHLPVKVTEFGDVGSSPGLTEILESSGIDGSDKEKALKELRIEIGDCLRCKLSNGRKNIVFGEGNPNAELMFIGEGPGREEDNQARPFVGNAGKLLSSLIEKMGLTRENVYIANIVKCRPPSNREPEEDEMSTCSPFLQKQIEIIQPKVIMALGKTAAHNLSGSKIPISKLRGRFYNYKDIPVMPTFHPAYLMRNPKDKWLTWDDAQMVLKRLKE